MVYDPRSVVLEAYERIQLVVNKGITSSFVN